MDHQIQRVHSDKVTKNPIQNLKLALKRRSSRKMSLKQPLKMHLMLIPQVNFQFCQFLCYFAMKMFAQFLNHTKIMFNLLDPKVVKVDDKKAPITKPAFTGPPPVAQRKDSTGQKVESQSISKSEDNSKVTAITSQAPQPHRSEKTPPFVSSEKPQHRYKKITKSNFQL